MVEPILTAIIPIREMSGRLQNLFQAIESTRMLPIRLILVIDSSRDGTYEEVNEFLTNYDRQKIMLIVGDFGSAGFARNAGLEHIKTKFVTFWDSDDIPFPDAILKALNKSRDLEVDFIVGAYDQMNVQNSMLTQENNTSGFFKMIHFARKPGIWRIVFKTEVVSKFKFTSLKMGEDQEFISQCFMCSQLVEFSNENFYRYFRGQKEQATSSKANQSMNFQLFDATSEIIVENSYKAPRVVLFMYIFQFLGMVRRAGVVEYCRRVPTFVAVLSKVVMIKMLRT